MCVCVCVYMKLITIGTATTAANLLSLSLEK